MIIEGFGVRGGGGTGPRRQDNPGNTKINQGRCTRSSPRSALASHRSQAGSFEHEPSHWRADSLVARFARPLLAHAKQDSPRARVPHDDSVVNGVSEYLG
jgi:hypothetical protein